MTPDNRPLLSLRGWSLARQTADGAVPLLTDIDLELQPGRWLAVLGGNGAGKSSLLRFLAADESPVADRAAILFQDPDDQIIATGVDRELTLGRPDRDPAALRREFGLGPRGELNPRLLSAGQKQRLALAVALGSQPEILLADEPTSLQDSDQAAWVLDRLDRWRHETGGGLVTATCDRREAKRADDLLLLEGGRQVLAGSRAEVWDDPRVQAVFGADDEVAPASGAPMPATGEPLLRLVGVGCDFAQGDGLDGVELTLQPGQRLGLVGPNGCGKSTLLAVAAGARRPDRGTATLVGRTLYRRGATDLDHGRALLAPQFPEYLFTRSTVAAEIALDPVFASVAPDAFLTDLGLPGEVATRNPHDLSSGQRRRLALGLVLRSGRPVLLLDEPTAALDAAGRAQVLALLAELPPTAAVLIASHDRRFLARAGCRVAAVTPAGLVGPD